MVGERIAATENLKQLHSSPRLLSLHVESVFLLCGFTDGVSQQAKDEGLLLSLAKGSRLLSAKGS